MIIIPAGRRNPSGIGTQSIVFPIVNEDQGPVTALIKVFKEREHLDVRDVDRPTAERMVAAEHRSSHAPAVRNGKRYLTDRPSTIELLTDPAQWTELQAIKVIFLLADREASSLGDPFSEELLVLQERSLTGKRLGFTSLEQNVPGFSVIVCAAQLDLQRVVRAA